MALFGVQIDGRRVALFASEGFRQQGGLAEVARGFTDQKRDVTVAHLAGDQIVWRAIRPTAPMVGVGRMRPPSVSL